METWRYLQLQFGRWDISHMQWGRCSNKHKVPSFLIFGYQPLIEVDPHTSWLCWLRKPLIIDIFSIEISNLWCTLYFQSIGNTRAEVGRVCLSMVGWISLQQLVPKGKFQIPDVLFPTNDSRLILSIVTSIVTNYYKFRFSCFFLKQSILHQLWLNILMFMGGGGVAPLFKSQWDLITLV